MNIEWMHCTTCKAMVQRNNTNQCLACHRGFTGIPAEDSYDYFLKSQEEESTDVLEDLRKESREIINKEEKITDLSKSHPPHIFDEGYEEYIENAKRIVKEKADADEKSSPKSMDACKQTKNGRKVGKTHSKRKKTTKKSKKKKEMSHGISRI